MSALKNAVQTALSSQKADIATPAAMPTLILMQEWMPSILTLIGFILTFLVAVMAIQVKLKQIKLLDMELEEKHNRRKEDQEDGLAD
jgi:hypothetical protein